MTPCLSPDDACTRPKPCRWRVEFDEGRRSVEWLGEGCEMVMARGEGFVEVKNPSGARGMVGDTNEAAPDVFAHVPRGLDHNGGVACE